VVQLGNIGPVHGPMLAVRAVAGNVAHCGSGAVPRSTNGIGDVGPHGDASCNGAISTVVLAVLLNYIVTLVRLSLRDGD